MNSIAAVEAAASATTAVAGVRWDDLAFTIDWPIRPPILSDRDAGFSDFRESAHQ